MALEKDTGQARWFDAWLLVLVAPAVIVGCFSAPFLRFDDTAHVGNPLISQAVPWYSAFRMEQKGGNYFPVTLLSYRFDRWLYSPWLHLLFPESGNAPGYRLTSLLFHLASALVLWRIFLRLKAGRWCSLFAAAAWAAHPAACESVAWISERKNVLAALFGFVALWFWIREWGARRGWLSAPVAFGFYLLAVLSKPTAAGFLAVFAAHEILYSAKWRWLESSAAYSEGTSPLKGEGGIRRRLAWGFLLAMFLATAAVAWVNIKGEEHVFTQRLGGSVFNTALSDVEIIGLYVRNMLFPLWLSFFYQVNAIISLADPRLWIGAISLAACVVVSLWFVIERRLSLFLWCWFLGALLPALNVVPVWMQMQDRYAYFSLPALLLLAALTVVGVARRIKIQPRLRMFFLAACGGLACGCLAVLAAIRSELYRYDTSLYYDALEKQPHALIVREHLGVALNLDAERAAWNATAEMEPRLQAVREEALSHLNMALNSAEARPAFDQGRVRLAAGILNMRLGHPELARKLMQSSMSALRRDHVWNAFLALAELELLEGRAEEALECAQKALAATGAPNPLILYWLGRTYEQLGNTETALRAYRSIPPQDLVGPAAAKRIQILNAGK